ncbi:MAG TPA: hypothetical protein VF756_25810 [Thermoanaerobaculia bacterium]
MERLDSERIDGAQQSPLALVPYGKGEVAEEVFGAGLVPAQVSGEKNLCVGRIAACPGSVLLQAFEQFLTVVEPSVGDETDLMTLAVERLWRSGASGRHQIQVNKVPFLERAVLNVSRSAARDSLRQPLEIPSLDRRAGKVDQSTDAAHSPPPNRKSADEPWRTVY